MIYDIIQTQNDEQSLPTTFTIYATNLEQLVNGVDEDFIGPLIILLKNVYMIPYDNY